MYFAAFSSYQLRRHSIRDIEFLVQMNGYECSLGGCRVARSAVEAVFMYPRTELGYNVLGIGPASSEVAVLRA